MNKQDYYRILGVSRNAGEREIKKAYKRLAIKFHPDRNPGSSFAEEKFKEIKEAYDVLIDPQKRAAYDQYGHAAFEHVNTNSEGFSQSSDFSDIFGDVFGDIFGNKHHTRKGADIRYDIELSLEEAVFGVIKKIQIPSLVKCNICRGSGAKPGTSIVSCITCRGQGQVHMRQGFFSVQQTCPTCHGQGKIIKDLCIRCYGRGKIEKQKILSIKIPAGVDNGDRIRLSGEGEIGDRGTAGDLYVQVSIKKHPIFDRKDNNLYCEVPINFAVAALGGEIEVPTINGRIKLKIPSETQTGRLFRMRGKGVKSIRNSIIGDLICRIVVETPVKLNDLQKQLLKNLKDSFDGPSGDQNSPRYKSFLDSVKKFFDNLTS